MDDPTELSELSELSELVVTDEVADDIEEELLIEEISIDGMCGVY